jgi:hypothetical protein
MKKILTLLLLVLLLVVSAVSMGFAFLATNDIARSYVSKKVLVAENIFTEIEKIPSGRNAKPSGTCCVLIFC